MRALLDGVDQFAAVQVGAHGAATSPWSVLRKPSADELKAGAYPTGGVSWQGMAISIENPAGSVREGVDEAGKPWRNNMMAHYGFFDGTRGADGDEVDVFLGPAPESDAVWILNQTDAAGGFDEHKVLAGFVDARQAVDAYRLSYSNTWDRFGPPIPVTPAQLQWWLKFADTRRPFSLDLAPPEPDMTETAKPPLQRVFWDSAAEPTMGLTLSGVLYAMRVHDASDGLLLDPLSMGEITEGAEVVALDALVTEVGKLKPKMNALLRVMEAAGGEVKPVAVQFSDLLRRFGGVHVAALFELSDGQTITAWFHNPDSTPNKFGPGDMLVSWKWQLNKKDVTIVVAPESGQDLNLREVARRLMRLAAKNSAAFAKANAKRAGTMAEIATLKDTLAERQAVLAGLHQQIEVARAAAEAREAAKPVMTPEEGYARGAEIGRAAANEGGEKAGKDNPELQALLVGADKDLDLQLRIGYRDGYDEAMLAKAEPVPALTAADRGKADFAAGKPYTVPEDIKNVGDRQDWKRGWQFAKNQADEARWPEWLGELYRYIEETYDVTTSDAQGLVDARESEARKAFEAGQTVEQVGFMLMGETRGAKLVRLQREAEGALWGIGSPDFYGVLQEFDLPDDWMPETHNRLAALDMGDMAKEFGRSIAVQINPDSDKPFRVIIVLYPDGRGVGSQWAATAQEAYAMVADAKAITTEPDPAYELTAVQAEGYAIGEAVGKSGSDSFLPTDSAEFNAAAEKYASMPDVVGWLREGFNDGYDAGRAAVTPAPIEVPAAVQTLREVLAGQHDTMALGDLLTKIEDAVKKLDADGLLKDEIDAEATAAITHWVKLDELANG